jgi:alpha-tubulin suppressor-like RCC1 family protein
LTTNRTAACWGSILSAGTIAVPTGMFSSISVGDDYACGVRTDGSVTCWGDNSYGQGTPI